MSSPSFVIFHHFFYRTFTFFHCLPGKVSAFIGLSTVITSSLACVLYIFSHLLWFRAPECSFQSPLYIYLPQPLSLSSINACFYICGPHKPTVHSWQVARLKRVWPRKWVLIPIESREEGCYGQDRSRKAPDFKVLHCNSGGYHGEGSL